MANLFIVQEAFDKAHTVVCDALKIKLDIGDGRGAALAKHCLGTILGHKGNLEQASTYLTNALHDFTKVGIFFFEVASCSLRMRWPQHVQPQIGDEASKFSVLMTLGLLRKDQDLLKKALEITEKLGFKYQKEKASRELVLMNHIRKRDAKDDALCSDNKKRKI